MANVNQAKLEQYIESWTPRIQEAFLASIKSIKSTVKLGEIEAALKRGDIEAAMNAVGIDRVHFRKLDVALSSSFEAAGEAAIATLPYRKSLQGITVRALFDVRNLRAEAFIRERSSTRIVGIVDDTRKMVRSHLLAGMEAGQNPRTTALELVGRIQPNGERSGGVIGLTKSQLEWVSNYSEKLRDKDRLGEALDNKLRDKRFDKLVKRAIRDRAAIPEATIQKMVQNYNNRALKYRANAIARTEALTSLNAAQVEAARQAVEAGQIDASGVVKEWLSREDGRERTSHAALDGKTVGLYEKFITPGDVAIDYPGEATIPASERINCRCFVLISKR
jgi:hypothetical protein